MRNDKSENWNCETRKTGRFRNNITETRFSGRFRHDSGTFSESGNQKIGAKSESRNNVCGIGRDEKRIHPHFPVLSVKIEFSVFSALPKRYAVIQSNSNPEQYGEHYMNSNADARARRTAAYKAASARGRAPSYGAKPAYPMCPQDTSGAGQGGELPPLHPPSGRAVACPVERRRRSKEARP